GAFSRRRRAGSRPRERECLGLGGALLRAEGAEVFGGPGAQTSKDLRLAHLGSSAPGFEFRDSPGGAAPGTMAGGATRCKAGGDRAERNDRVRPLGIGWPGTPDSVGHLDELPGATPTGRRSERGYQPQYDRREA